MAEGNAKIIRFSQKDDEAVRHNAKKIHRMAVLLKQAGFPVRTIAGKIATFEMRKRFNIPKKNNYAMVELQDQGQDKNDEIKDWLLLNSKLKVINDGTFEYSDGVSVYQLIVDCSKI